MSHQHTTGNTVHPPRSGNDSARLFTSRGASVAHALLRAAATLVSLPRAAENAEASPRAKDDPWRERLWRHKPSALPNRMVVDSGGARTLENTPWKRGFHSCLYPARRDPNTPACRVGTSADTRNLCDPEASPRVATRHARVRAPLACSSTIARTLENTPWKRGFHSCPYPARRDPNTPACRVGTQHFREPEASAHGAAK